MSTTPTFQSTTSHFRANLFDAKGRKVSAHIESADLMNSLTTVDGTHTHLPESKSFHNVEPHHAYNPRSAHSIYNESEINHSRILPEEIHHQQTRFQSPTLSEISHHYDFPKSASSSYGFNYFTNMRNSAPDIHNFEPKTSGYPYRESSFLLNSPANNMTSSIVQQKALSSTLPSHTTSHKTLSSVIGDLVERDREERRLRELKFTEEMVKDNTTLSTIIKNEGRWMKELREVDSLLKSCKEFSEAATRKRLSSTSARWSEPVSQQYRPSPVQERAYRNSEKPVLTVKPSLYKEECEDYVFNVSLRRSRENSLKNLKAQKIMKEMEEDAELRHRKDMFYMEEAIRTGTTITDMVKNERQRELDMKLSQSNMQYIKEDCASKVLL